MPPHAALATTNRRVGLLGGSFDPVHRAHLALAQAALAHLAIDEVWWIPAGEPWQRAPLGATAQHRLAMLRLAVQNQPRMRVLTLEIDRAGPTYTADTLQQLQAAAAPGTAFTWLLGTDQLRNFCTWERWQAIATQVTLAVAQRAGAPLQAPARLQQHLQAAGRSLLELPFEPLGVSATDIRQRCQAGLPIHHLVPAAVADYIQQHQLYSTGTA